MNANDRPNILFCLADDASLHFGAYGCPWVDTPGFDRVAREGLLFEQAFTPNAKCAPSRAAILTGRNSWQLEDAANHQSYFPAQFMTVWEALGHCGYHTGYTGKGWAPGNPGTRDGSTRELTGPGYNEARHEPPTGDMSPWDYAENFRRFLDAREDESPFCFWYGCFEPHRPYTWRSGVDVGGRTPEDVDRVPPIWPDSDTVRTDLLDYGLAIESFDWHLQQMIGELERRGELDRTLLVVTSDNGMPFPRVKGQDYYSSTHLPLAIRWPEGIDRPGRRVNEIVSFIDFAPTFLEVAGVTPEVAGMAPVTGLALQDVFAGTPRAERDYVLVGKERHDLGRPGDVGYPIRGILRDNLLYLRNFEAGRWPAGNPETGYMNCDGSPTKTEILERRSDPIEGKYWRWAFGKRPIEELYCVDTDPACLNNLAQDPNWAERRQALRTELESRLRDQGDPRMLGGAPLDELPTSAESLRNYYDRFLAGELPLASWINSSDVQAKRFPDQDGK